MKLLRSLCFRLLPYCLAVPALIFAGGVTRSFAQTAGSLDPTFGDGGKTFVKSGLVGELLDLALQPDGKIVGGGYVSSTATGTITTEDFAVCRFNANGTLDASFGSAGVATLNFDTFFDAHDNRQYDTDDRITSIAVQSDGKILAAGFRIQRGGTLDTNFLALARFNADGSLDTSFGTGGKVKVTLNGYRYTDQTTSGSSLALLPDGKFVVGCTGLPPGSQDTGNAFVLLGYNADGTPDGSFGSGGSTATRFPVIAGVTRLRRITVQPDGKIIAAGKASVSDPSGPSGSIKSGGVLLRYTTAGALDGSFGSGGTLFFPAESTTFSAVTNLSDARIDPDGKIIAVGTGYNDGTKLSMVRVNADGTRDPSFGTSGIALSASVHPISDPMVRRQDDGKYVVGQTDDGQNFDFDTVRLNADGTPDTSYGGGRDNDTDFEGGNDLAYAMLLLPDGKVVLGGSASIIYNVTPQGTRFALTRSLAADVPHPAFFNGEVYVYNGVIYLALPNGNPFGYYSYLTDQHYIYHFDLGYEYVFDANDGHSGVYLYDFKSNGFFYTSPVFPFPYLYDFTLNTVLYYYPDPSNPGRYNTDGYRFFYRFDNGQIIVK